MLGESPKPANETSNDIFRAPCKSKLLHSECRRVRSNFCFKTGCCYTLAYSSRQDHTHRCSQAKERCTTPCLSFPSEDQTKVLDVMSRTPWALLQVRHCLCVPPRLHCLA